MIGRDTVKDFNTSRSSCCSSEDVRSCRSASDRIYANIENTETRTGSAEMAGSVRELSAV